MIMIDLRLAAQSLNLTISRCLIGTKGSLSGVCYNCILHTIRNRKQSGSVEMSCTIT